MRGGDILCILSQIEFTGQQLGRVYRPTAVEPSHRRSSPSDSGLSG